MDIMLSVRWVVILSIIAGIFFWHKYEVKVAVNEYAVTHQLEYAKELTRLTEVNIKTKSELENKVKVLKDKKDAEIKTINARYDSIIAGLQHRPSRQEYQSNRSNNTSNPESTKKCLLFKQGLCAG